jgi:hypothetical protein
MAMSASLSENTKGSFQLGAVGEIFKFKSGASGKTVKKEMDLVSKVSEEDPKCLVLCLSATAELVEGAEKLLEML